MTNPINPKKATWVNPTQAVDQTGATVAWDSGTDLAGVEVTKEGASSSFSGAATFLVEVTPLAPTALVVA